MMADFMLQNYYPMIIAIVMAFVITVILGYPSIPLLRRLKAGQSIREDGPQSHLKKAGTPTMGGLFMVAALVVTTLIVEGFSKDMLVLIIATVGFAGIGFIDDFIKVVLKRNLGLNTWQKLILQTILAIVLAVYQLKVSAFGTHVYIPFVDTNVDFGFLYIPFIVFFVVAMVNSVNLTDGLDGLASGVTVPVCLFLGMTAVGYAYEGLGVFSGAVVGACAGFLVYNHKPAKVFMGDTGSLALGGAISAVAILMNVTLIIPIVGLVYVAEAVSVILQVGYFKKTGKRLFKMAPLHHHYELSGWGEVKVVKVFSLASVVLCILGALIMW